MADVTGGNYKRWELVKRETCDQLVNLTFDYYRLFKNIKKM